MTARAAAARRGPHRVSTALREIEHSRTTRAGSRRPRRRESVMTRVVSRGRPSSDRHEWRGRITSASDPRRKLGVCPRRLPTRSRSASNRPVRVRVRDRTVVRRGTGLCDAGSNRSSVLDLRPPRPGHEGRDANHDYPASGQLRSGLGGRSRLPRRHATILRVRSRLPPGQCAGRADRRGEGPNATEPD